MQVSFAGAAAIFWLPWMSLLLHVSLLMHVLLPLHAMQHLFGVVAQVTAGAVVHILVWLLQFVGVADGHTYKLQQCMYLQSACTAAFVGLAVPCPVLFPAAG